LSFTVFLAVLGGAVLHASWNAIIRFGDDKVQGMLLLSTSQGLMGVVLAAALPWPRGQVWLWLIGAAVLHSSYKVFLTYSYERGDLSRVYPIARGTAPIIVALFGLAFLADKIAAQEYAGIFLVACGIMLMARGVFAHGESRAMLPFALASATATAGYTLVDGVGARVAGQAGLFVAWMFLLDGGIFLIWAFLTRGRKALPMKAKAWALGTLAGGFSYAAYWIAVWAMTQAPIALVAALRETSILFAVLIGVLFFHEQADRSKFLAAGMIVAGILLTRL